MATNLISSQEKFWKQIRKKNWREKAMLFDRCINKSLFLCSCTICSFSKTTAVYLVFVVLW